MKEGSKQGRTEGMIHTVTRRKNVRKGMIDGKEGRKEVAEERTPPGLLSAQTSKNMRNPTEQLGFKYLGIFHRTFIMHDSLRSCGTKGERAPLMNV